MNCLLESEASIDDLGSILEGVCIIHKEVDYLIKNEWAKTTEDILWRRTSRTKWGLLLDQEINQLEVFLNDAEQ